MSVNPDEQLADLTAFPAAAVECPDFGAVDIQEPVGPKGHQVFWANSADHVACHI